MSSSSLTRLRPSLPPLSRLILTRSRLLHRSATLYASSDEPLLGQTRRSKKQAPSITGVHSKPIILEQPDAFRPPSHPRQIRNKRPRMVYGHELTEEDHEQMENKTYPYSMPGKNTLMYQFMHARWFHAFLAISILTSLMGYIWLLDFHASNRYPDLLPHSSLFYRNPFSYIRQYYQTWRLNQAAADREHKEKREIKARDVESRRAYRRAHDVPEVTGLAAWLGLGTKEEEERLAEKKMMLERATEQEQELRLRAEDFSRHDAVPAAPTPAPASHAVTAEDTEVLREGGGEQKPTRKVFFGIWGW